MARAGETKPEPNWDVRLMKAREFHKVAKIALDRAINLGVPSDVAVSNMILAAIGYADAMTAAKGGKVNKGDHGKASDFLRQCLGRESDTMQVSRFSGIIGNKDTIQYGGGLLRLSIAVNRFEQLDKFAEWSERTVKIFKPEAPPKPDEEPTESPGDANAAFR